MIDWSNPRGLAAVEQRAGTRLAQRIGHVAPPIYALMAEYGHFRLSTIEAELLPRGYAMTPHSLIVRDMRATMWFVNASDQSGKWFEQIRAVKQNLFFWHLRDMHDKSALWERERQHAAKSKAYRAAQPIEYDMTDL